MTINNSITVENFKYGDLGITLDEFPDPEPVRVDPLVIDLDKNGVELVDLVDSTSYFDLKIKLQTCV